MAEEETKLNLESKGTCAIYPGDRSLPNPRTKNRSKKEYRWNASLRNRTLQSFYPQYGRRILRPIFRNPSKLRLGHWRYNNANAPAINNIQLTNPSHIMYLYEFFCIVDSPAEKSVDDLTDRFSSFRTTASSRLAELVASVESLKIAFLETNQTLKQWNEELDSTRSTLNYMSEEINSTSEKTVGESKCASLRFRVLNLSTLTPPLHYQISILQIWRNITI